MSTEIRTADYSADFSDYADYEKSGQSGEILKSAVQSPPKSSKHRSIKVVLT